MFPEVDWALTIFRKRLVKDIKHLSKVARKRRWIGTGDEEKGAGLLMTSNDQDCS
jgi:hypothetical protein